MREEGGEVRDERGEVKVEAGGFWEEGREGGFIGVVGCGAGRGGTRWWRA